MTDLKPCPFCGWGKARIIIKYLDTKMGYVDDYRYTTEHKRIYVRCNRCYAHGGSISGYILKRFVKANIKSDWTGEDLFSVDLKADAERPDPPSFVSTKEQLEDKAAALWNMRLAEEGE